MPPTNSPAPYCGRFAPTPSGDLHRGSLLTALAGWLQARCNNGAWLIRFDDLDAERCTPGSASRILSQLEAHGLHWSGTPRYQSQHVSEYQAALEALQRLDMVYPCSCTRAELARTSAQGPDGPVYAGTCRHRLLATTTRHSLRLRLPQHAQCLDDAWQGRTCRELGRDIGDVAVWRADGVTGYHLACIVDDEAQGITEVVRGMDLLGASIAQSYMRTLLGTQAPLQYRHLPLLVDASGRKLSKQNHAQALAAEGAAQNLWWSLSYLQQEPPPALLNAGVPAVLEWALAHWQPALFFGQHGCTLEE